MTGLAGTKPPSTETALPEPTKTTLTEPAIAPAEGERTVRGTHDSSLRRLLLAGDAVGVILAYAAAVTLAPAGRLHHEFFLGLMAVPLMLTLFKLYGLYDRDVKRISYSTVDDLPWLFHATVIGGLLFWLYSRWTPMGRLDYAEILSFGVLGLVLVTAMRSIVRSVAGSLIGHERALLVGGGELAQTFIRKLAAHPEYRLKVIGVLIPENEDGKSSEHPVTPVLGTLDQIDSVAARHDVSRVVFSPRDIDEWELEELLRHCQRLSLKVSVLPKLSDVLGPAVEVDDVEGVTVLGLNPPWLPRSSRSVKRVMDLVIAGGLLALASPLLLLLALAVKLDSRGPVLFAQERVGKGGRRFRLYKFRTMVADAEHRRAELVALSTDPNW